MKKKLCLALSILLGIMAVGCGNAQPAANVSQAEEKETLKVGLISSISALPLLIAEEQGYFEAAGVDVEIEYFKSAKDRDAALQAGELEGVLCDETAIAIYQNAGLDMKITGKTDGEFVLLAGKGTGIESAAGLEGKKIAISENTVIEYTLDLLLDEAGVSREAVEKISIPSMATRLEMLNSGEVDAALMPNPFSDTALANGATSLDVVDSDNEMYISVTAFNGAVIEEKAEAIKAYYKAYNEAVDYINATDVAVYEGIIIETIGYPETMRGNIVIPEFHYNTLPTAGNIQATFEWCQEKGLLSEMISPEQVMSEVGLQ